MDIILIPGFWLDASSWDEVIPALRQAGHGVHALTLPGMESKDADRSEIILRDHVDAAAEVIDSFDPDGKVMLVGHSGGGAIAHAGADERPDRVARPDRVDSGPLGEGGVINDEFPVENGEVPLPDWSWVGQGHPYVGELAKIRDVDYIDLPTGHWPQFARPEELGRAILASVAPPDRPGPRRPARPAWHERQPE